jgi:hypothetical protein
LPKLPFRRNTETPETFRTAPGGEGLKPAYFRPPRHEKRWTQRCKSRLQWKPSPSRLPYQQQIGKHYSFLKESSQGQLIRKALIVSFIAAFVARRQPVLLPMKASPVSKSTQTHLAGHLVEMVSAFTSSNTWTTRPLRNTFIGGLKLSLSWLMTKGLHEIANPAICISVFY